NAEALDIGKATQTMLQVDVVGHLAHLAVVDDVEAGFDLLGDAMRHCLFGARLQGGRIDWFPAVLPAQELDEIYRPRQAPDMGGQDAVCAEPHGAVFFASLVADERKAGHSIFYLSQIASTMGDFLTFANRLRLLGSAVMAKNCGTGGIRSYDGGLCPSAVHA